MVPFWTFLTAVSCMSNIGRLLPFLQFNRPWSKVSIFFVLSLIHSVAKVSWFFCLPHANSDARRFSLVHNLAEVIPINYCVGAVEEMRMTYSTILCLHFVDFRIIQFRWKFRYVIYNFRKSAFVIQDNICFNRKKYVMKLNTCLIKVIYNIYLLFKKYMGHRFWLGNIIILSLYLLRHYNVLNN